MNELATFYMNRGRTPYRGNSENRKMSHNSAK